MSLLQIVCENCGAKYRLPETFKGDKAKCKQCGNVIDVAAQRTAGGAAAPAAPAAAKPAAARPAAARPAAARPAKAEPKSAKPARAARPARSRAAKEETPTEDEAPHKSRSRKGSHARGRAGSRGRHAEEDSDGDEGDGPHRHHHHHPKKSNKTVLISSAVGFVAVLVVAIILVMNWNESVNESSSEPVAKKPADATQPDAPKQPDAQDATAQKSNPGEPAEGALPGDPPGDPSDPAPAAGEPPKQPETDDTPKELDNKEVDPDQPRWMRSKVTSVDQIFDPKTGTEPVVWPDYVTDEDKAKVAELLANVENGGRGAPHAKKELETMGHKAIAGIVNRLREVNYLDSWDSMFAWELNKILEAMTIGMNVGFVAIEIGEDIDPRKADWNAKTAKAWLKLLTLYPTEDDFKRLVKSRKGRHKVGR